MRIELRGMKVVCFLFKQKTGYGMLRGLVGSEMCIRNRYITPGAPLVKFVTLKGPWGLLDLGVHW